MNIFIIGVGCGIFATMLEKFGYNKKTMMYWLSTYALLIALLIYYF
jgi:hypothetical protein